jgi:5-methylcytosine-specific restriction endonuclease McrA
MTRNGDDITAVSSPKRTIPFKLRRALEARFPTCALGTCANDQFLEIDHVVPLEDHGRTELDNLWRLCSHHHRLKTYEGWKVVEGTAPGTSLHRTTPILPARLHFL